MRRGVKIKYERKRSLDGKGSTKETLKGREVRKKL